MVLGWVWSTLLGSEIGKFKNFPKNYFVFHFIFKTGLIFCETLAKNLITAFLNYPFIGGEGGWTYLEEKDDENFSLFSLCVVNLYCEILIYFIEMRLKPVVALVVQLW